MPTFIIWCESFLLPLLAFVAVTFLFEKETPIFLRIQGSGLIAVFALVVSFALDAYKKSRD